jgi:hypothetical protein
MDGRLVRWLAEAAAGGTMTAMLLVEHQRGTLIGLAIGDALGAAIEFQMLGTFPAMTGSA